MMRCVKCGSKLRDGSAFCTCCGAKLDIPSAGGQTDMRAEAGRDDLEGLFDGIRTYVKSELERQQKELSEKDERIHTLESELQEKDVLIAKLQEEIKKAADGPAGAAVKNECPKCGNTLSEDMMFCNQCGTKVR